MLREGTIIKMSLREGNNVCSSGGVYPGQGQDLTREPNTYLTSSRLIWLNQKMTLDTGLDQK